MAAATITLALAAAAATGAETTLSIARAPRTSPPRLSARRSATTLRTTQTASGAPPRAASFPATCRTLCKAHHHMTVGNPNPNPSPTVTPAPVVRAQLPVPGREPKLVHPLRPGHGGQLLDLPQPQDEDGMREQRRVLRHDQAHRGFVRSVLRRSHEEQDPMRKRR